MDEAIERPHLALGGPFRGSRPRRAVEVGARAGERHERSGLACDEAVEHDGQRVGVQREELAVGALPFGRELAVLISATGECSASSAAPSSDCTAKMAKQSPSKSLA